MAGWLRCKTLEEFFLCFGYCLKENLSGFKDYTIYFKRPKLMLNIYKEIIYMQILNINKTKAMYYHMKYNPSIDRSGGSN